MNYNKYLSIWILIFFSVSVFSQHHSKVYKIDTTTDITLAASGLGLSLLGLVFSSSINDPTRVEINNLDASNINSFDRGAVNNYSSTARRVSDLILYAGATFPFLPYLSKKSRGQGLAIGVMILETFMLTNSITNITKASAKRFRPFAYNPDVDLEKKLDSKARFSFISGHASNTAAMSFFTAKVFTDLHPDMKNKWLLWTTAALIPASISYFRVEGGKHFPTDVIAGYSVGAAIGLLVPTLHLHKNVSLNPGAGGGFALNVHLNK